MLSDEIVEGEQSSIAVTWIAGNKGRHLRKGVADVFDVIACNIAALYLTAIPAYFLGKTHSSPDFLRN